MRLDNLPTGVFTAGPAPKVQKSPRLLRKMRALLFRLRVLFPAWDVPPSFFCRSAARAAPSRFPRLGFRRAPGSEAPPVRPLCRAVLRPALLSWRPQAGNTQRQHPAGGTAQAAPCACGERLPPHILPRLSATIPLPCFPSASPCACPGAASCPASPSAQGVCKNIPHFP